VRVLFHLLDAGTGGGQLVATRVAAALVERGDEVGLAVPSSGPAAERFGRLGARVFFVDAGTLRRPLAARALGRVLERYDLLYSHTAIPGVILGAAAARLARRPQVVHQHTFPYFSRARTARVVQQALLARLTAGARFIAVADHVRAGLEAAGIPAERIVVVPNGVPPADVPAQPAGDKVTVGMLARLDPGKNVDVFLEAAGRAAPATGVRYVVGGVSSPFSAHERELRERAAHGGIEIVQPESGDQFVRELDIVVIPSSYEGSPLVLLEAMAAGRAVVASDIPGIREALEPAAAGVLVPPRDAATLAAAIEALVDDEPRRAELGRRAREVAAERYRLGTMLERTLAILDEALSRSTP
jgi:glycosyltransferase involved in cell wall biosynthesis